MRAVLDWKGEILSARMDQHTAQCMFGTIGKKEAAVVTLKREKGLWRFEDIHSPDLKDFKSWGKPVGK